MGTQAMSNAPMTDKVALQARSPFELRVNLGRDVPESDVRSALASGDMGFLHSFTTGSTVDGPGVRVVAWTTGCHWRCLYCHNPDTWTLTNGIPVTLVKAVEELSKYRHGLRLMSGGFTLSGGEPLMQDRFAVKLFAAAKKLGIHTALDTNGHLGSRLADPDLENIDLVLLDLKAWDPDRHHRLTGMDIDPVLAFARRLAVLRKPVWARFAAGLQVVERVDVLPFHQMGRYKWRELGAEYKLDDFQPPSREAVSRACALFREAGLKAF
jgi:pyruvate formate lyase activating enzyme